MKKNLWIEREYCIKYESQTNNYIRIIIEFCLTDANIAITIHELNYADNNLWLLFGH